MKLALARTRTRDNTPKCKDRENDYSSSFLFVKVRVRSSFRVVGTWLRGRGGAALFARFSQELYTRGYNKNSFLIYNIKYYGSSLYFL